MDAQLIFKRIIYILAFLFVGIIVYIYFSAILPILMALLTAMILEPLIKWLKKKLKVKNRWLPVTIVFTSFIILCTYILYISLTKVAKSIYEWSLKLPEYAVEVQEFFNNFIIRFNEFIADIPQGYIIVAELEKHSDSITNTAIQLATKLINSLGAWIQSIPNLIFVMLIYFMVTFLISLDFPRLVNVFYNLFKEETSSKLRYVSQKMGHVFLGYWKAQFILSIGVFIITYVSLLFISPNAALIMTIIIWFVDIIPLYVGPALILVPWGVFAMILGSMNTGIQLLILATVITVLRRIIEPKVLGDSIGLAALPTVLSMYFGFVLFGVMGLIFGPFIYIAIRSAIEGGLFDIKFFKDKSSENE